MLSNEPVVRKLVVISSPVLHSVLLMVAFNLSMTDHRQARKGCKKRTDCKVFVSVSELCNRSLLIRIVHEVDIAFQDFRFEYKRVLYAESVFLVLLILQHVHECGVIYPVHAKSSYEVSFHHPERFSKKKGIRDFLCNPVYYLSPEFLRDTAVELLVAYSMACSSCDITAMARFRIPEALYMALRKSHGSIESDDREVLRYMYDLLYYGFSCNRIEVIKLGCIIPRHRCSIVSMEYISCSSVSLIDKTECDSSIGTIIIVIFDLHFEIRIIREIRSVVRI